MCQSHMATKELTRIALMACILFAGFTALSTVLYLEVITLLVVLFAMVFPLKESFLACVVFGFLNMFVQGVTIFSMMYILIYPGYTLLIHGLKPILLRQRWLLVVMTALCSFATGMLLDLPFMMFSEKVTLIYLLMGFRTSLIQGALAALQVLFLFDPLYQVLIRIKAKG